MSIQIVDPFVLAHFCTCHQSGLRLGCTVQVRCLNASCCQSCEVEGRAFTSVTPVAKAVRTDSELSHKFGGGVSIYSTPGTVWLAALFQCYVLSDPKCSLCLQNHFWVGTRLLAQVPTIWRIRNPSRHSEQPKDSVSIVSLAIWVNPEFYKS